MLEPILTNDISGPMIPFTFIGGTDDEDQCTFQIEEADICLN
jgi:hypothetical protein